VAIPPDLFADVFADLSADVPAPAFVHAFVQVGARAAAPVFTDLFAESLPRSVPASLHDTLHDSLHDPLHDALNNAHLDAPSARPSNAALHPGLWHAHQLARPHQQVQTSGFAELDEQLPGGGWPQSALTELLLPHPGVGELRLLAPVLAAVQHQQRSVMWFDPPAAPCTWALAALGLQLQHLVVVRAKQSLPTGARPARSNVDGHNLQRNPLREKLPAADVLWALEQALKSGHVGAVVAWLPARLPADALRRLQLAAQAHEGPAFLLRADTERQRPSAAPLRLLLASAGPDVLRLHLFKRRGPPAAQPLLLQLPAVLSAPALLRAQRLGAGPVADLPNPSITGQAFSPLADPQSTSQGRSASVSSF
jgi:protein ImuA